MGLGGVVGEVHYIAFYKDVGSFFCIVCKVEVFSLAKIPCGRLRTCPYDFAGISHGADGQYELVLILDGECGTAVGDTFNQNIIE